MKHCCPGAVLQLGKAGTPVLLLSVFLLMAGCLAPGEKVTVAEIEVSSDAFPSSGLIPAEYTCDGMDLSPALSWGPLPAETASVSVLVTDPDAPRGSFTHWVLYNIPKNVRLLSKGVPAAADLTDGSRQGMNDFGGSGYAGPCPPRGAVHRYSFTVYALDVVLNIPENPDRKMLEAAMDGHILARGELMGKYGRK